MMNKGEISANDRGSYDYSSFVGSEEEYERLKLQALIAWELEKEQLVLSGLKSEDHVLDVGCGPGFITRQIAEYVADGYVTGLEADPKLHAFAEFTAEQVDNFKVVGGNVYDLSFDESSFDYVYARFLFQHLRNPLQALSEARRVLKPGGKVAVVDVDDQLLIVHPSSDTLRDLIKLSEDKQSELGGDRFIGRKLPEYFKQAGFTDVEVRVVNVTNQQIGNQAFLGIISGFKLAMLAGSEGAASVERLQRELQAYASQDFHGTVGVYFVTGIHES
ncbi:MAG: methyltransferase domain-containing protein [Verrucomicrobiota bacterium]